MNLLHVVKTRIVYTYLYFARNRQLRIKQNTKQMHRKRVTQYRIHAYSNRHDLHKHRTVPVALTLHAEERIILDSGGFNVCPPTAPPPEMKLVWTGHFAKNWYMVDTVVCRMKWTFSGWPPPSVCVATPLPPQHTSVRTATAHQTHYRSYWERFLQVIWPNQQCQAPQ